MHKKIIYFNQKSLHRERQADTPKYAADFFEVISPLKKEVDNLKTFNKPPFYMKIIIWLVARIPMVNIRRMPKASQNAEYIYTRGDIPVFSKRPFVIELDNPYVLTFYNYFAFKLFKPIIKFFLKSKKCKKIVCISEACRQTFLKEMGDFFQDKTVVLYPRIKDFDQTENVENKKICFVFVGLDPLRKGCYELLEAFSQINNTNIELMVIGFDDSSLKRKYLHDNRIRFLGQIKRQAILDDYLPKADVFVLPTYHESFGIVALEALSRGLGIITTNVFALPEVCIDGYNGRIIKNPYVKENEFGFVDITKISMHEFSKRYLIANGPNPIMISNLKYAIEEGIKHHKTRKKRSQELYKEKFCQKAREKSFLHVFE